MKTQNKLMVFSVLGSLAAWAQTTPGAPQDNGLTPKTDTIYVNRKTLGD